jgi:hypothetical protein
MQWMVVIVGAALALGLWRGPSGLRRMAFVVTVTAVLAVWFTQMKA